MDTTCWLLYSNTYIVVLDTLGAKILNDDSGQTNFIGSLIRHHISTNELNV